MKQIAVDEGCKKRGRYMAMGAEGIEDIPNK